MKLILAIVLLSFSFSAHSFLSSAVVSCPENSSEGTCGWSHKACASHGERGCNRYRNWSGSIPQTGYVDKKIADTEEKIQTVNETLVQSINNLGTELKTGIVIRLLKEDDEFRKLIEDIVESKMKAKSEGDDAAK